MKLPDFGSWLHAKPVPPGTRIRLNGGPGGHRVWWHGIETVIVCNLGESLGGSSLYKTERFGGNGLAFGDCVHRDNFVILSTPEG